MVELARPNSELHTVLAPRDGVDNTVTSATTRYVRQVHVTVVPAVSNGALLSASVQMAPMEITAMPQSQMVEASATKLHWQLAQETSVVMLETTVHSMLIWPTVP